MLPLFKKSYSLVLHQVDLFFFFPQSVICPSSELFLLGTCNLVHFLIRWPERFRQKQLSTSALSYKNQTRIWTALIEETTLKKKSEIQNYTVGEQIIEKLVWCILWHAVTAAVKIIMPAKLIEYLKLRRHCDNTVLYQWKVCPVCPDDWAVISLFCYALSTLHYL